MSNKNESSSTSVSTSVDQEVVSITTNENLDNGAVSSPALSSTATPPPSRTGSDASDPSVDLTRSVEDLNEFSVTSHSEPLSKPLSQPKPLDVGLDSDSESFDEKVLEGDTFQWKVLPHTDEPIEMTTFPSSSSDAKQEQEVDSDDDMPPLIDPSSESDNEKNEEEDEEEDEEGSTTSGYSDRELVESEEEESEEEESEEEPEEYRVLARTSEEYPGIIRFLFFLFLILHLINHAILLKEKRERELNPCFRFHY